MFEADIPGQKAQLLGGWLVEQFAETAPDRIFHLIGQHQQRIGAWFWWRLTHKIGLSESEQGFDRWFDILIQTKPDYVDVHSLHCLAEKSHRLGQFDRVLKVFEVMAETKVVLREPYRSSDDKPYRVRGELEFQSPEWNLNEVWKKCLFPHLDSQCPKILDVCSSLLLKRHSLACTWNGVSSEWDRDSSRRSAIEPHEQDEYPEAIDVVIDSARAAIEHIAADIPRQARIWICNHHSSPSQLLQRLAIHGIGFLKDQSADDRLILLLKKGLHNGVYRQEAFSLLEAHYAQASPGIKEQVITAILSYVSEDDEDPQRKSALEHHQWLSALLAVDTGCELIRVETAKIKDAYGELPVRPYPGLNSWAESGWSGPESPWSVEDLLSKHSDDWFNQILSFNGRGLRGPSRSGLCLTLSDAAKKQSDWAFKLCDYLKKNEAWESDFWSPLLSELCAWPEVKEEAEPLLQLIKTEQLTSHNQREIADILYAAVKNGGVSYVCDLLPEINNLATSLWSSIEASTDPLTGDDPDWLNSSINTTEGTLAEYWIHALSAYIKCNTRELVEPYRSELVRLCSTDDPKTQFSIPVITQQISFLFGLDQSWANAVITPLFSSVDDDRTSQAWHGFLGSRGPTEQVFKALKDAFTGLLPRLDTVLAGKKDRFVEFYTAVTFWYVENPNGAWIPQLLNSLDDQDRVIFSKKVGSFLPSQKLDRRQKTWDDWLKTYWENRINGAPKSLVDSESRAMLEWLPHLPEQFSFAVGLAIRMPSPGLGQSNVIQGLKRADWVTRYPVDVAKLIIYLLGCPAEPHSLHGLEDLLAILSQSSLSALVKDELNEALIQSGKAPIP